MALLNLVTEEMGFGIQFRAVVPNLAVLTVEEAFTGEMGRKKKKENMEGLLQQTMNSDGESERVQLNQSGIEKALGEGADVMEI